MTDAGLRDALLRAGATIDGVSGEALHFGSAAAELDAALTTCALVARSSFGRLVGDGPDLLDLLHRLSTNRVRDLAAGQGAQTVLTTPKGRIVERLFVHHLGAPGVLLLGGPASAERVAAHLARFTFAERTGLRDAAAELDAMSLIGPRTPDALLAAGLDVPPAGGSVVTRFEGRDVFLLGHDAVGPDGCTAIVPTAEAGAVWRMLATAAGHAAGCPAGREAAEAWRVLRGLPLSPTELNDDRNPLEAGLIDAVSFDKGCYVGQEVVARLNTYDKVSRVLLGFELPAGIAPPGPGAPLFAGDREAGQVTTAVVDPRDTRVVGLCYVKRRAAEPGTEVTLGAGGPATTLLPLPPGRARD